MATGSLGMTLRLKAKLNQQAFRTSTAIIIPRVRNYTEESIEHWNKSAESNVTSGGLHVIVHEEKRSS